MSALLFWVPVLLLPYWLGPIVVWLNQKWSVHPDFEPFDATRHPLDEDVATAFRQTRDALVADGFTMRADLVFTQRRLRTRVALLDDRAKGDLALTIGIQSAGSRRLRAVSYVEFPLKLRDGRTVSVNNNPRVGPFDTPPGRTVVKLPDVRDPARLHRVRDAYLDRHFAGAERVPFEYQDDPARFLSDSMVRELVEQVEAGTWWRDDVAQVFRPTFVGAWLGTWRLLPPFATVRRVRVRRRAAAILKELGLEGGDAHPIPSPRARASLAWPASVLAAALLFYVGGPLLRSFRPWPSGRITIPSDLVVPADFPGAVRALERLAGATATPLTGTDTLGRVTSTPGFAVDVPSTRAADLVAEAQERFLDRGFFLFRSEQHFGIRDQPDRVALFPRADPYEILLLMGTNGANYGIEPDSIIAWLRALGRDQPFVLTGIGFDWLEGRFTTAIRDPEALARRFYAFCPDIVEQGTETVGELEDELRRSLHLYCWWD